MILTAYYDESGTHANSPATVLAGFVGDTNEWVDFEIEWKKVLRGFGITHVRAKHLFHRQGQHKEWEWSKVDELYAAIMYLLQERKHIFASKNVSEIGYPQRWIDLTNARHCASCLLNAS